MFPRTLLKYFVPMIAFVIVVGAIILISYSQWIFTSHPSLPTHLVKKLEQLGLQALDSKDAPIAAVVLYADTIIGEGYNTVQRDKNAGGHAEINALSDAFRRVGIDEFHKLNRESLTLITTLEPCPMCKGAILNASIKKIIFLKPKPVLQLMKDDLRAFLYQWRRSKREPQALQDSLLYLHPLYKKE